MSSIASTVSFSGIAQPMVAAPVPATGGAGVSAPASGNAVQPKAQAATSPTGGTVTPQVLKDMQSKISQIAPELQFSVDQQSGRTVIMLTNMTTHEIIQQFPSEAALQISAELDRYEKGRLINLKA
jgi:flagellar protein FlaG